MENIISIEMKFDFSGESFHFTSDVTMPKHMGGLLEFADSLPRKLGRENNVDSYSYMHETMETSIIVVTEAKGYVSKFLVGNAMPLYEFISACNQVEIDDLLQHISETHFPNIEDKKMLHKALLSAYEIGVSAGTYD